MFAAYCIIKNTVRASDTLVEKKVKQDLLAVTTRKTRRT